MAITVRRPTFDVSDLPFRWVADSRLATWFGDAAHVFIPLGEQFFIDTVREYRVHIDDEELRREVAAFIGQEAIHGRVHESVWAQRREHGVPVDAYADAIRRFQTAADPLVPPQLKLAITAALEHFTAAFGRSFLEEDLEPLVGAEMAALLRWHGAEEIEHRSVAFDVLTCVDDRLALRVAGLILAAALLSAVPAVGVMMFATEEVRQRRFLWPRLPKPALLRLGAHLLANLARDAAAYVEPAFRPGDVEPPKTYEHWLAVQR